MHPRWILRHAAAELVERPGRWLVVAGTIGVVTALFLAGDTLHKLSTQTARAALRTSHVVAYFSENADSKSLVAVQTALKQSPKIERIDIVSTEQAYARLQEALGDLPDGDHLLENLEGMPLPRSLEITLAPTVQDLSSTSQRIAGRLRTMAGIVTVETPPADVALLDKWRQITRVAGWVLFAVGTLGGLILCYGTLLARNRFSADRLRTMQLLGYSPIVLRGTHAALGALCSATGAVLGTATLCVLDYLWPDFLPAHQHLVIFPPETWWYVVGGSAFVGWMLGLLTVSLPGIVPKSAMVEAT